MGGSLQGAGLAALADAIAWCVAYGRHVAVVHGGGPRISQALADIGIELPFVHGERVTTDAGMAVVERVLADEVNGELVGQLRGQRIAAVGMSGADEILVAAPLPNCGRTARVDRVAIDRIVDAADVGCVPVIAPIGSDGTGLTYNINADLAAGAIAGALNAERIVFLTDVPGIYENWEAKTLLTDASSERLEHLLQTGRFHQGMIPKVSAVLNALQTGVRTAYVVSGTDAKALVWAVRSGEEDGETRAFGTRIRQLEAV